MPQVHGVWQVCVFGSCLPSGCCRAVERQTTMGSAGSPLLRGSCQSICCRPRRQMPPIAVNMMGASAKPLVVATAHICSAVEPSSVL